MAQALIDASRLIVVRSQWLQGSLSTAPLAQTRAGEYTYTTLGRRQGQTGKEGRRERDDERDTGGMNPQRVDEERVEEPNENEVERPRSVGADDYEEHQREADKEVEGVVGRGSQSQEHQQQTKQEERHPSQQPRECDGARPLLDALERDPFRTIPVSDMAAIHEAIHNGAHEPEARDTRTRSHSAFCVRPTVAVSVFLCVILSSWVCMAVCVSLRHGP